MLNIKDLHAKIEDINILKGVNLNINTGDMAVLMGQNGSGKSTLAQVTMGNPSYQVTGGSISFEKNDLLELDVTERAKLGIFLSFQYPSEIEGVTVSNYLRLIYNTKNETNLSPVKFRKLVAEYLNVLKMDESFLSRYLNEGFSGGEKKRMEMLQMLVLNPKFVILDEVDSGLDVDALKVVADSVNYLHQKGATFLIITHYSRILTYLEPNRVLIMTKGQIVKEGPKNLAIEIEAQGYEGLK